jgi:hypothetical protein
VEPVAETARELILEGGEHMKNSAVKNKLRIGLGLGVVMFLPGSATAQVNLNLTDGVNAVHILPTLNQAPNLAGLAGGPLLYHAGGSVMANGVSTYAIFW